MWLDTPELLKLLLWFGLACFGLYFLATIIQFLRQIFRTASDGRDRGQNKGSWWVLIVLGFGGVLTGIIIPIEPGLWIGGIVLIIIGIVRGNSNRFRLFGQFDEEDRRQSPEYFEAYEELDTETGQFRVEYVYEPPPDAVRIALYNALGSLLIAVISYFIWLGVFDWVKSLSKHGEMGFGGLIFLIPVGIPFIIAVAGAASALVAFMRFGYIIIWHDAAGKLGYAKLAGILAFIHVLLLLWWFATNPAHQHSLVPLIQAIIGLALGYGLWNRFRLALNFGKLVGIFQLLLFAQYLLFLLKYHQPVDWVRLLDTLVWLGFVAAVFSTKAKQECLE